MEITQKDTIAKKILFTIFIVIIIRLGNFIPVPNVDQRYLINILNQKSKATCTRNKLKRPNGIDIEMLVGKNIMPKMHQKMLRRRSKSVAWFLKLKFRSHIQIGCDMIWHDVRQATFDVSRYEHVPETP